MVNVDVLEVMIDALRFAEYAECAPDGPRTFVVVLVSHDFPLCTVLWPPDLEVEVVVVVVFGAVTVTEFAPT